MKVSGHGSTFLFKFSLHSTTFPVSMKWYDLCISRTTSQMHNGPLTHLHVKETHVTYTHHDYMTLWLRVIVNINVKYKLHTLFLLQNHNIFLTATAVSHFLYTCTLRLRSGSDIYSKHGNVEINYLTATEYFHVEIQGKHDTIQGRQEML